MNSKLLVALLVPSEMLTLATSASADCAWVLWEGPAVPSIGQSTGRGMGPSGCF
jgi:hypothetical protein